MHEEEIQPFAIRSRAHNHYSNVKINGEENTLLLLLTNKYFLTDSLSSHLIISSLGQAMQLR